MKTWSIVLLFVFFTACRDEPKHTIPDALKKEEMPAPVQQLFSKLDQHPDSMGLRLQLVDALDSLGAFQQAMVQMDSLIKKDSLNYGLWFRKAQLQQNTRDTTGALRSYRYAIRIYPAPDAMLAAANLLAERKDTLALAICRQVDHLRMGREYSAHTSFISGIYYARTGNTQKAMNAFNTCIANDFTYLEAYMEKGFLFYDSKKNADALQVFRTLSTVKSTYPDAYYWMAKCYEAMNNKTEAIANYQKALTLDPKLKDAEDALKRLGSK
jgi:tetratricopeptide (TPR) repeat protein